MDGNLERRTVERGPTFLIQLDQALHLGGNQVDAGAAVGVDEVQNASAVVPVLHHHRRPTHHRQEREGPLGRVVEGPAEDGGSRQRHETGEARGDELPHFGWRAGFGGGQAAPDALGMPGCSRGVEHRSAEGLVLRFGVRSGAEERLEVDETRIVRGADGHRQFHGGGSGVGQGFGNHVGEAVANQDGPGVGVLDDVGHFRGHEVPTDGYEHDPGVCAGESHLEPLVAVAGHHRDGVARSESGVPECVDEAVHPGVELGPCPCVVVVGECEFVAAGGRRFPCQYRHGSLPLFGFARGPFLWPLACTAPTLRPDQQDSQKGLLEDHTGSQRIETLRPDGSCVGDRSAQIGPSQFRPGEVRSGENRPFQVRPLEVRPGEVRPEEARPREVRPFELGMDQVCTPQIRPFEECFLHEGVAEPHMAEIRPYKVCSFEARPGEVRPSEVRAVQVRPNQVGTGKVRSNEDRAGKIRPPEAGLGFDRVAVDFHGLHATSRPAEQPEGPGEPE